MAPKAKKGAKVEISAVTGKPKLVRKQMTKKEMAKLKADTSMTKEEWKTFQSEEYKKAWPKPDYMSEKPEASYVRDGGEGAYRDKTYEIVTRWMAETKISYRPHAKAPGSKSHVRYEKYAVAKTVGEALELGSYPLDWCFDYEHGFIKVHGPVRDEPIDISKVANPEDLTDVDNTLCQWYRKELARRYNLKIQDLYLEKGGDENVLMRAHRLCAERHAKECLEKAQRDKRAIKDEEVERTLDYWAFKQNTGRVNVFPEGHTFVRSDTVGLLRDRTGDIHLTHATRRYPNFVQIICQWLRDRMPSEVPSFKFTSLNLNCNYAAKRHRDGNNFGPSMIKAFGPFTGGQLNVFPDDDKSIQDFNKLPESEKVQLDIQKNLAMFNGNSAHEVEPFQGKTRYSIVYFTIGCHAKAKQEDMDDLKKIGFPVPAKDENPHALLGRPGKSLRNVPTPQRKQTELPALRLWPCSELLKNFKFKGHSQEDNKNKSSTAIKSEPRKVMKKEK
eukprot:gnl/MRDRNA2_/MRDRNA2_86284_c0_seq2.p1 gnl/MRDRNA2_/MRDRNA2_86284_c0~~gnl/MRDRNA2_/MRDRNA2_86284_c0_seq2.p1  ORF type:complete len:501 (+),score=100.00 gnl/MRDRNA2_/MRDRNA2_86284_c0_seq2:87-1589(+)